MLTKNRSLFFILLFALSGQLLAQMSDTHLSYIERYRDIAVREMERAGIPASIKLAQGLLESNAGQSNLARRANNHFGMKCGSNWQGDTMYKEDDDYNESGQLIKSCFRAYRNGQASFVAHSEFLRDPRKAFRYGFLFRLEPTDYKAWAFGLKRAGYATSPTYPEKLISLIERYQLQSYDTQSVIDVDTPGEIVTSGILQNNDVRYVVVGEGESLDDIANKVAVNVNNLLNYNQHINRISIDLPVGDKVYLQRKRNGYRGKQKYHIVKPGETMFALSQQYAVRLVKLYTRNRLSEGEEPAVGEQIKLRGWKVREQPKLATETPAPTQPSNVPDGPELEMEEPDDDEFIEDGFDDTPTQPSNPPSTTPTQPSSPPVGTGTEQPGVIINPGSQPVNPPPGSGTLPPPVTTNPPSNPPSTTPTTTPSTPPTTQPTTTPTPTPPANTGAVYHEVKSGDTLWNISRRYNTTVDAIKQLNNLTNNNISLGARLRVQ